jgi:hypothetical protein
MLLAAVHRHHLEAARQEVDGRHPDPRRHAEVRVRRVAVRRRRVVGGAHHALQHVAWDPGPVVAHLELVAAHLDVDVLAAARQVLVDRVAEHLQEAVQHAAAVAGVPDVHPRACPGHLASRRLRHDAMVARASSRPRHSS